MFWQSCDNVSQMTLRCCTREFLNSFGSGNHLHDISSSSLAKCSGRGLNSGIRLPAVGLSDLTMDRARVPVLLLSTITNALAGVVICMQCRLSQQTGRKEGNIKMQKTSSLQRQKQQADHNNALEVQTKHSPAHQLIFSSCFTHRKLKIRPEPDTLKHQNKKSETSYNINGQTFKILSLFCGESS